MHRSMRRIVATLVAAAVLASILSYQSTWRHPAPETTSVTVSHVYDGDTFEAAGLGKVRLLGIDTLDAYNEDKAARQASEFGLAPQQVVDWAQRATEFARRRLKGKKVEIIVAGDREDDYGRVLAYVHIPGPGDDDVDLNLLMVESGLAVAYRRYDHPRRDEYVRAEARARSAGVGLWEDARARN